MKHTRDIRKHVAAFPALPALSQYVLAHLNNPNVDFGVLSKEMRYDPGLTANVLKLANSAYFGVARQIESLQTAMVLLGMKQLFQLIVSQGVAKPMTTRLAGYDLEPEELLRHSVWVAVASEEMSRMLDHGTPDLLFTAGLLHDMGKIILDPFLLQNLPEIQNGSTNRTESFDRMEAKILGLSHAKTGAELLDHWKLPAELVAAAQWHHDPLQATSHQRLVQMIHLADMLAYTEGIGTGIDGFKYAISQQVIADLGLRTKMIERIASRTLEKMNELEKLLTGK